MGPMQAILSGVISIFYYAMVIALLWKIFQMATDLSEIKAILADIRRNAAGGAKPAEAPLPAPAPVAIAAPVAAPVYVQAPVQVAAPVAAYVAPPAPVVAPVQALAPMMSGPISLESAEALLREIAAESEALEAAQRLKVGVSN